MTAIDNGLTSSNGSNVTVTNSLPESPSGWVCPLCGRVNAPHVSQCPCRTNAYPYTPYPYTPYPWYPYTTPYTIWC